MRRSKAPSFKNVEKKTPRANAEEVSYGMVAAIHFWISPNFSFDVYIFTDSPEMKRGTNAVLSLLLGESENVEPNINSESNDTLENSRDEYNGCSSEPAEDSFVPTYSGQKIIFNVVYAKQSQRKHKVWEGDGTLEVDAKFLTLKDEKGKVLGISCYIE